MLFEKKTKKMANSNQAPQPSVYDQMKNANQKAQLQNAAILAESSEARMFQEGKLTAAINALRKIIEEKDKQHEKDKRLIRDYESSVHSLRSEINRKNNTPLDDDPNAELDTSKATRTQELKNFLNANFPESNFHPALRTAQERFIIHAQLMVSEKNSRNIRFEPQLPYDVVGDHCSSMYSTDSVQVSLASAVVLPVLVFDPAVHLPFYNPSASRYKVADDFTCINNASYFSKFFCSKCTDKSGTGRGRFDPHEWRYRMCFDRDSAAVFAFKVYKCNCAAVDATPVTSRRARNDAREQNEPDLNGGDDEEEADNDIDPLDHHSDVDNSICRLDHMLTELNNCGYGFVAEKCPVVFTKKRGFTQALLSECVQWQRSKSNVNEFSSMLVNRYADHHHRKVYQIHRFIESQQLMSQRYHHFANQKDGPHSKRTLFPAPAKWAEWMTLFRDPKYRKSWTQPLFPPPGVNYLRTTVLQPYLRKCRNFLERLMDNIQRTQIISLDTTYSSAGRYYETTADGNSSRTNSIRSSGGFFNEKKQVVNFVFLPLDSSVCLDKAFDNLISPERPRQSFDGEQILWVDNCCAVRQGLTDKFEREGIKLKVLLDLWHWLHRFFARGNLRQTNHRDAWKHRAIFEQIRGAVADSVEFVKANNNKKYKKFHIPDAKKLTEKLEALYESWKKNEKVKDIVTTEKFVHRWNLQMAHVDRGCLSDPFPSKDLMYRSKQLSSNGVNRGRTIIHCLRGTNTNENCHRKINCTISSTAAMSPEFAALLLNFLFYEHNYDMSVRWDDDTYIPHADPALFYDLARVFRRVHSPYAGSDTRYNPYYTKFHGSALSQDFGEPPKFHYFEKYHREVVKMCTPGGNVIPIPGWLHINDYINTLARVIIPPQTQKKELGSRAQKITPVFRCIHEIGYCNKDDTEMFSNQFALKSEDCTRSSRDPLPAVKNDLSGIALSVPVVEVIGKLPTDDEAVDLTQVHTLLVTCVEALEDKDANFELPRKLVDDSAVKIRQKGQQPEAAMVESAIDDDDGESDDEADAIDETDAEEWCELLEKDLKNLKKRSTTNNVAFTLQRLADVTASVVLILRCGVNRNGQRSPDPDASFFVPRDIRYVQNRPRPSALFLFAVKYIDDTSLSLHFIGVLSNVPFHPSTANLSKKKVMEQMSLSQNPDAAVVTTAEQPAPVSAASPRVRNNNATTATAPTPATAPRSTNNDDAFDFLQQDTALAQLSSSRKATHISRSTSKRKVVITFSTSNMSEDAAEELLKNKDEIEKVLKASSKSAPAGAAANMLLSDSSICFPTSADGKSINKALQSSTRIVDEKRKVKEFRAESKGNKKNK